MSSGSARGFPMGRALFAALVRTGSIRLEGANLVLQGLDFANRLVEISG